MKMLGSLGLLLLTACPGPVPNPSPSPTVVPTASPTSTPVTENHCPALCPDSAKTINARCLSGEAGKCRTDSTPRCGDINSDNGYCGTVTGDPSITSCKANPEGSQLDVCDKDFLLATCMPWFYSVDNGKTYHRCLPDGLGAKPEFSCSHFDDWIEYKVVDGREVPNPYTGKCETIRGVPVTGYHMVPHGLGLVRACTMDQSVCSLPIKVNH